MAEGGHHEPDAQREEFELLLKKPLARGDTWYVVDFNWFCKFKKHIGLNNGKTSKDVISTSKPGPIDNTPLLQEGTADLKDELVEEENFFLVHEIMWEKLLGIYGMSSGSVALPRKVIEHGRSSNELKVEVYKLKLKLCLSSDMSNEVEQCFSEADTTEYLESKAKSLFNVPKSALCKLWIKHGDEEFEDLKSNSRKLFECGIFKNLVIVLDKQNSDGNWTNLNTKSATQVNVDTYASLQNRNLQNSNMPTRISYSNTIYGEYGSNVKPGLCGLCNLGNTCFMNSVLQLMSNTPPVTKYFLSNQHMKELNLENPIGMYGEIAKSFGDLIHQMWSGNKTSAYPSSFKMQVAKFAPQFSGYQQHDSQELLTFLLDGLHEDLNRIKKKPYIELKDEDDRDDSEVAKEAWDNYRKRNDSIIVDLFHGLLKSTVICPECNKISVTFDPFCYLSVPLPTKKDKCLEVKYHFTDTLKPPVRMKVIIPKIGCIKDLCDALHRITGYPSDCLIIAHVFKNAFHRVYSLDDLLEDISDKDDIRVFEVQDNTEQELVHLAVYLKELTSATSFKLFGWPFFVSVPKENCSYHQLHNTILESMSRYFKPPKDNTEWWNSSTDSDMSNGDIDMNDEVIDDVHAEEHYELNSKQLGDSNNSNQYRLFNIKMVNSSGDTDIETLHPGKHFISMPGQVYLAVECHPKARTLFYNEDSAHHFEDRQNGPIKSGKKSIQLQECLELFTTREKLGADNAWYCSRCKKHQLATKKFDLWSLPKILVIHLKRFSYTRYWRDKLDNLVTFPIDGLDMSKFVISNDHKPTKYDLIGVCNHSGGMGGGHYTSYAKNKDDQLWYCFDDNHVSPTSEDSVISKAAYVLFYMRRDSHSADRMNEIGSHVHLYNNAMDID